MLILIQTQLNLLLMIIFKPFLNHLQAVLKLHIFEMQFRHRCVKYTDNYEMDEFFPE